MGGEYHLLDKCQGGDYYVFVEHLNLLNEKIFRTYQRHPRTAILMSGVGTNAEALLSSKAIRDLYNISLIVTNNVASNARALAANFDIPILELPARTFPTPENRGQYFAALTQELTVRNIEAIFYAGFMKIVPPDFCENFPGINIHPANLTILDANNLPKYRGMNALPLMRAECGSVCSTVHIVTPEVDTGLALALTESIIPKVGETNKELHSRLKKKEHVVFPEALRRIAVGLLSEKTAPMTIK